jgi:aminoglycoside 6'-N-acetyltransferase I
LGDKYEIKEEQLIRKLLPQDHSEWPRLRRALWPETSIEEHEREMQVILSNIVKMPVFVAEGQAGSLCGLLEVSINSEVEGCRTNQIGYLEGWYVDQEWREKGIGKNLIKEAEKWAKQRGISEMASNTTSDYPLSSAVHQRLGYKVVKQYIHFRKEI